MRALFILSTAAVGAFGTRYFGLSWYGAALVAASGAVLAAFITRPPRPPHFPWVALFVALAAVVVLLPVAF